MRENRDAKARRLLVEARVVVDVVDGRFISAWVRGDSGTAYQVRHDAGSWACPCECRQVCSHIKAVMLVTSPVRLEAIR